MDSKLIFENYLLVLKSTVEVYVHGTLESSNESVRNVLKLGLDETMNHQDRTYKMITDCGWYKVSNIPSKTIKQTLNKVQNSN